MVQFINQNFLKRNDKIGSLSRDFPSSHFTVWAGIRGILTAEHVPLGIHETSALIFKS